MQDGVTVRDVMSREFVGVSEGDDVVDVLEVMTGEMIPTAVVIRGSRPVGVVHDLDVLELVTEERSLEDATIKQVMRSAPEPVAPDEDIEIVLDRLGTGWTRQLPVTEDDQLVGVVSESDVLAAAASLFPTASPADTEPTEGQVSTGETGATGGTMGSTTRTEDPYTNHNGASAVGATDASLDAQGDTVSTQGVCESCGSLVGDLGDFNGQLLCRECRDV